LNRIIEAVVDMRKPFDEYGNLLDTFAKEFGIKKSELPVFKNKDEILERSTQYLKQVTELFKEIQGDYLIQLDGIFRNRSKFTRIEFINLMKQYETKEIQYTKKFEIINEKFGSLFSQVQTLNLENTVKESLEVTKTQIDLMQFAFETYKKNAKTILSSINLQSDSGYQQSFSQKIPKLVETSKKSILGFYEKVKNAVDVFKTHVSVSFKNIDDISKSFKILFSQVNDTSNVLKNSIQVPVEIPLSRESISQEPEIIPARESVPSYQPVSQPPIFTGSTAAADYQPEVVSPEEATQAIGDMGFGEIEIPARLTVDAMIGDINDTIGQETLNAFINNFNLKYDKYRINKTQENKIQLDASRDKVFKYATEILKFIEENKDELGSLYQNKQKQVILRTKFVRDKYPTQGGSYTRRTIPHSRRTRRHY
jgi:hypothetical protein